MTRAGPSLWARALRYLAMREHSRAELGRKLLRHAEDSPEDPAAPRIARLLDELVAQGLLDDRRAAEALVVAQSPRLGGLKLRQRLRARGVDAEVSEAALAGLADTELARARAVWQRRFGQPAADAAEYARQTRFLAGRGFDAELIRRLLRGRDED